MKYLLSSRTKYNLRFFILSHIVCISFNYVLISNITVLRTWERSVFTGEHGIFKYDLTLLAIKNVTYLLHYVRVISRTGKQGKKSDTSEDILKLN